ncbi:hypothetical protein BH09MYX1_BH09MYX1_18380 [soil metagenome]
MKFCKSPVSSRRQGEHVLRAALAVAAIAFPLMLAGACHRNVDPGFDVVALPSAAYLAAAVSPDGGPTPDAGQRDGGSGAGTASVKCGPPPDEEFEPNDDVAACPSQNEDDWELDVKLTTHQRDDREKDVCCFRRPTEPK